MTWQRYLTPRAREVLAQMVAHRDEDEGEILQEGVHAWLGDERTSGALVKRLLRLCLIEEDEYTSVGLHRYRATSDAAFVLAGGEPPIVAALRALRRTPKGGTR